MPYSPETGDLICAMVAEGKTVRQIAEHLGCSLGGLLYWVGNDKCLTTDGSRLSEQYARARDIASDLLEADIMTAAYTVTPDSAPADRVRIDALKWIAARRSPKRYGDRVQQELTGPNGGPVETVTRIEIVAPDGRGAG